jgi:VanZ family protein
MACAALLISGVMYGSFLPFRVDWARIELNHFAATFLHARDFDAEDAIVNMGLYAVLAAVLAGLTGRRGAWNGLAVLLLCSTTSVAVEAVQTILPHRVSSAADVCWNVLGAALGLAVFASAMRLLPAARPRLWNRISGRPWSAAAVGLSCGLLMYGLMPFDFVMTSAELHTAFQRLRMPDWAPAWRAVLDEAGGAAWFAVLGWVLAREFRLRDATKGATLLGGLVHGLVLALLIETLQLFTKSHVPEAGVVIVRALACLGGAWVGIGLSGGGIQAVRPPAVSTAAIAAAALLQAGLLGLSSWEPFATAPPGRETAVSLPFHALWLEPSTAAAAHATSIFVSVGLLTITVTILMRRCGLGRFRPLAGLAVLGLFIGVQAVAFRIKGSSLDFTDAILVLIACSVALAADRRIHGRMFRAK